MAASTSSTAIVFAPLRVRDGRDGGVFVGRILVDHGYRAITLAGGNVDQLLVLVPAERASTPVRVLDLHDDFWRWSRRRRLAVPLQPAKRWFVLRSIAMPVRPSGGEISHVAIVQVFASTTSIAFLFSMLM